VINKVIDFMDESKNNIIKEGVREKKIHAVI
jgi:hypothetical protein